MNDNSTIPILISAIVALSGALVWLVKIPINVLRENTKAMDRGNEVMTRLEDWLRNWRAR